jgi:homoserine kinase
LRMLRAGASEVHLAGSGPGLLTLVTDRTQAEDVCQRIKKEGLEPHLAETLAADQSECPD